MSDPVKCDQCGRELSEEDFRAGGAFRDQADILCAECHKMYREDERRRERQRKLRDTEAAIEARSQARRGGSRTAIPRVTRSLASARKSGRGAGRRDIGGRAGLVGAFIAAAIVAFAVAVGVVFFMKKDARRADKNRRPPGTRPRAAPREDLPETPAVGTPAGTATPPPKEDDERDERVFRKSLFGPGGQFEEDKRNR